jgi:hypothetical protein
MAAHHSTDMVTLTSNNSSTMANLALLALLALLLAPMVNVVSVLPLWVELVERSLETNSVAVLWVQSAV